MLTVKQAAKKLKFSEQYVCRLIGQGRMFAIKHGRAWILQSLEVRPAARGRGRPAQPKK